MNIVDLSPEYLDTYLACLEDYSEEIKEGLAHKRRWYEAMKDKGLRVKLALVDGKPSGMIHYVPIEHAFVHGWCPAMNMCFERAKRAAAEFGDAVEFRPVETLDRAVYLSRGIADGLYIDGKAVRTGPPPSYEKIRRKIAKKIKK